MTGAATVTMSAVPEGAVAVIATFVAGCDSDGTGAHVRVPNVHAAVLSAGTAMVGIRRDWYGLCSFS